MNRLELHFTAVLITAVFSAPAAAQVTQRVSVDSSGVQGNSGSHVPSISADGRLEAFYSDATNLVPGDTNGSGDVFVRDLQSNVTERVSVDSSEVQGILGSQDASISADGRYVAFISFAFNLVPGDTNSVYDVFVRDRLNGTTERVSLDSGGVQGNGDCFTPSISADGRYVAFYSDASNLVLGDTNGVSDVFVRDRQLATTERISVDSGGAQGNGAGSFGTISADGRYVAFQSLATNLVIGDTNGLTDVFVRDRQLATTERISVDSGGAQGTGGPSNFPSISADGRYVAFTSAATNLVAGDTNVLADVFVRDRLGATTERVSVDSTGAQATGGAFGSTIPSITADGRYVAFRSAATNLVPGDTNGFTDVFVRDRQSATTESVSVDSGGAQGNGSSSNSLMTAISADGRYVAFDSNATNLVPGDTNGFSDVFVRERGGGTDPESVGQDGAPSNGDSNDMSISADDRYVAFSSAATNIVTGDTNGARDVFVRDRNTAITTRVSVGPAAAQSNGDSGNPWISSDGRYVAFDSVATNLVAGDTNAALDVFVHDRQTSTTTRMSVSSGGVQGNASSGDPAISGDGSAVAFESLATNLVTGDTNAVQDVFVRNGLTSLVAMTLRASVDTNEVQGNAASGNPAISTSGALVAFDSDASNLVVGDSNASRDVFVRGVTTTATERVSVDSGGTQGLGASTDPSISGNGLFVGFASAASNLVAGDSNLVVDVFVRDRGTNSTLRVSADSGGTQGAMASGEPSVSADGRFVAFASDANNLVPGDTNLTMDVFVRDTLLASTERVSVDSGGTQGLGASTDPSISADGRHVAFESDAANLAIGDTNGLTDTFVRDHGVASAFEGFCPGDGTVAPCPCANSGTSGRGCQNSGATGGALLTVTGVASLSADTVQFTSSGERPTALSIFLQGTTVIAPINYGDGIRCTGGNLKRLYTKTAVGGVVVAPVTGELSISDRSAQLNQPIPLGTTRPYQVYYRDGAAGFCSPPLGSTFNVSNGFLVAWGG